jgi:hypothetical protein
MVLETDSKLPPHKPVLGDFDPSGWQMAEKLEQQKLIHEINKNK